MGFYANQVKCGCLCLNVCNVIFFRWWYIFKFSHFPNYENTHTGPSGPVAAYRVALWEGVKCPEMARKARKVEKQTKLLAFVGYF